MRSLKKNQQPLKYATYAETIPIYERDENGDIIYVEIDGEMQPVIAGEVAGYNKPVIFYAGIAVSGGEAEAREYGFDIGSYEAVLVTMDKSLPIAETSRIWHTTEPAIDAVGTVDGDSADYFVLAVKPGLNVMRYLLKKVAKAGE